jgi:hypothetical protein
MSAMVKGINNAIERIANADGNSAYCKKDGSRYSKTRKQPYAIISPGIQERL